MKALFNPAQELISIQWFKKEKRQRGKRQLGGSKEGENKYKYPHCSVCKITNHLEKDYFQKGKSQCKIGKKFGHTDQTCRLEQNYQVGMTETKEEIQLLYACQAATVKKDDVWLH